MGFLTKQQLERLRDAGVSSYHCNIETSRRYFPSVCSTHSFDQKLAVLERVKEVGLRLCSGGIVGMGETWEDRIDMALTLAEYRVDSIPINVLIPIEGTPFENLPRMTEPDILRTVAIFRWLNPSADIRLAAGRGLLPNSGEPAFRAGASAAIVGDMLSTEACASIRADRAVLDSLGRDLKPLPTLN